jgi:hypothetical protein
MGFGILQRRWFSLPRAAISRWFLHAGLSQGADPHIGGGVNTVESLTST